MQRRWRIAVGQLAQETNSFVPFRTGLEHFERRCLRRGAAVLDGWNGERTEVPGFLSILQDAGADIVPLPCAAADSGGPVTDAAFEALVEALLADLQGTLPLDGILLALHGAMVLEDAPDAEGLLLSRLRARWPALPIGVSLDLHGHIRPLMLQPDVVLAKPGSTSGAPV